MEAFLNLMSSIWGPTWAVLQFLIQVGLLSALIYLTLYYLRNTPAVIMLAGLAIIILFAFFLSQLLGLEVIGWLLEKVPPLLALGVVILFHPELRRALADIGSNPRRYLQGTEDVEETIDILAESAFALAEEKTGALIAIERDIGMRPYAETGVAVDAPLGREMLMTIFHKDTPLHDGAVIIRGGVIDAASCFFPLTQAPLSRELGTRHRAAVGISEQTDAVVIVVSEERGTVSLAYRGRLVQDVEEARLRRHLGNFLLKRSGPPGTGGKTVVPTKTMSQRM